MNQDLENYLFKIIVYFIIISVINLFMMLIWNQVMPQVFGVKEIGYFQLLGLYSICSYLANPYKIDKD